LNFGERLPSFELNERLLCDVLECDLVVSPSVRQDGILRDIDLGAVEALETKSTDVEQAHLEQVFYLYLVLSMGCNREWLKYWRVSCIRYVEVGKC
jgi:hypothetical protein